MKTRVSLLKCGNYDQEKVNKVVRDSVDNIGGMKRFVHKGEKVLLKANLLSARDVKEAVTTHPAIVSAVIDLVKEAGGIPSVGDSPAIHSVHSAAKKSGILDLCEAKGVELVELKVAKTKELPNARVLSKFKLAANIDDFDKIINLPKIKTHLLCGLTLAVKNLYGCIAGKMKAAYHFKFQDRNTFSKMLLDLHDLVQPDLTVVDGIVGMEGQGPGSGDPVKIGVVMASSSAISLDTIITKMLNYKPKEVPTVYFAQKFKYPGSRFEEIQIIGNKVDEFSMKKFKKYNHSLNFVKFIPFKKQLRAMLTAKPILIESECIKCGNCEKVCPAKAITMKSYGPKYDYSKCFRCYCCHEVCPKKAITLKKNFLVKIFEKIRKN